MKQTLKTFRFDPEKSGQVLNRYVKASGMSGQKVADELGYTYDIVNNITHGKNKDLMLERAFKICVLTGHSVCEYLRDMLKDEDIDFADRIHVLREPDMVLVPYDAPHTEISPAPVQTSEDIRSNPVFQTLYQAMMQEARETHQANLERFRKVYEDHARIMESSNQKNIDDLRRTYDQELENRDKTYDRSVSYLKSQVEIMQQERKEHRAEIDAQRERAEKAEAEVKDRDRKRHNVFWGMLSVVILLLVLMTTMMIIDAPGIGMGWD